jgi:osmotically inducible protein OsmC
MALERRADAVWEGDLQSGSGRVAPESGAWPEVPVNWRARTESPDGMTSPEELLAAAHASCFAMALSNGLAQVGHAPERLVVSAAVTFGPRREGGFAVKSSKLDVRGRVQGIDAEAFQDAAFAAGEGCPISVALNGNVPIEVQAELDT